MGVSYVLPMCSRGGATPACQASAVHFPWGDLAGKPRIITRVPARRPPSMDLSYVLLMCSRGGAPPGCRASVVRFRRGRAGQEALCPNASTSRMLPPVAYSLQSLCYVLLFIGVRYAETLIAYCTV